MGGKGACAKVYTSCQRSKWDHKRAKLTREFIKATSTKLDEALASLPQQDQHDLLDALAAEIGERLDQLREAEELTEAKRGHVAPVIEWFPQGLSRSTSGCSAQHRPWVEDEVGHASLFLWRSMVLFEGSDHSESSARKFAKKIQQHHFTD